MNNTTPNFFVRLLYSLSVFFRYIFDGKFADAVHRAQDAGQSNDRPETGPAEDTRATVVDTLPESALQLLSLLQQEARLIDFVQEDLTGFSDADIGAVGRVVHAGCRKIIAEHFTLAPVSDAGEQSKVTLESGFNAAQYRLTGNLTGEPPFTGTLVHPGWRVTATNLPQLVEGHDLNIIAPAEVEL